MSKIALFRTSAVTVTVLTAALILAALPALAQGNGNANTSNNGNGNQQNCTLVNAVRLADDSIIATADNFEVSNCDVTVDPDEDPNRDSGIFNDGFSGTIHNNTVTTSGGGTWLGIEVRPGNDGANVTVTDNEVENYIRVGILANGEGAIVNIRNNTVTGPPANTGWAANGIQLGFGATGNVQNNTVASAEVINPDWSASCILAFEVQGVNIQGNQISECDLGIAVAAFDWPALSGSSNPATDNNIANNSITNTAFGISLQSVAFVDGAAPETDDNKVVNNIITNASTTPGNTGISFLTLDFTGGNGNPTAENNKIIGNAISGFDTEVDTSDSSGTKAQANFLPVR